MSEQLRAPVEVKYADELGAMTSILKLLGVVGER